MTNSSADFIALILQGPHSTGQTGIMATKNPCQGKHGEFGNFAETQGIWFAQVVNSLILNVKVISLFAAKISILGGSWISQFCVCNGHKS